MIQKLNQSVINQIAAGEVVERPSSIIKELIENAIDAQATEITIEVLDGGLKEIIVIDNGTGITEQDIPLVFEPYATSKLTSIEDLNQLYTMGFRGEALSSISSVTNTTLETRHRDSERGYQYIVESGELSEMVKSEPGTKIQVKNLFYTVPARRKFLKSASTELGHISKMITYFALAYPDKSFRYTSQKKSLAQWQAEPGLERVAKILKINEPQYLIPLEYHGSTIHITGFIGHPRLSRKSAQTYIFVNNRPVMQPMIQKAIQQGFDTMLEVGHYPMAVLFITVDPSQVDVNVHPRKTEVKFADDKAIFTHIRRAIRDTLTKSAFDIVLTPLVPVRENMNQASSVPSQQESFSLQKQVNFISSNPQSNNKNRDITVIPKFTMKEQSSSYSSSSAQVSFRSLLEAEKAKTEYIRILDTYILYANQQGLMMIDQHAAHEKVILEELLHQESSVKYQQLMIPIEYTLPTGQTEHIEEILNSLPGFRLVWQNSDTFQITAIPTFIRDHKDIRSLFDDLIQDICAFPEHDALDQLRIDLLKTVACRAAVKAGDMLTRSEIEQLINSVSKTDYGFACCHGRPTMVQLDKQWIEKQFSR